MPVFLVDLFLDGYDTKEEEEKACEEFIYDQLNFTASGVTIRKLNINDEEKEDLFSKNSKLKITKE